MKIRILVFILILHVGFLSVIAQDTRKSDSTKVATKKGWNFGILPSIAFDADLGFQGGLLCNVYDYGSGEQYPEYLHSIYVEGAYTTKHYGVFRLNYDSRYVIPGHRLTVDATYLPDAMCDFYGYNGFQSRYNKTWHTWNKDVKKMDEEAYKTRAFYKFKRDFFRLAGDIEGNIHGGWRWNAGIGVLGYITGECDINMLNGKHKYEVDSISGEVIDRKAMDPDAGSLYRKYVDWGLIEKDEKKGGWHPYLRGGITFDTRNRRQCPTKGIYSDVFFTYTAAFNGKYGQQWSAGYNHLQINFNFRHYVSCYLDKVVFAYRIGIQNTIAGKSPFYMNSYLNTLFIQRVLYEGLGGGNSLRGILRNRILANGIAYANVEFRFRIVNFDIRKQHFYIGINPFFDIGMVTQAYDFDKIVKRNKGITLEESIAQNNLEKGLDDVYSDYFGNQKDAYVPHYAVGVGLKIGMNENFVLSVDWAMPVNKRYYRLQDNGGDANFYVKMGYLF